LRPDRAIGALAIPLARRVFTLAVPPLPILLASSAAAAAAIVALTLWRRLSPRIHFTPPRWPGSQD
jgi:hypothetical protein